MRTWWLTATIAAVLALSLNAQEAPLGAVVSKKKKEENALNALKGNISGIITWATSRAHTLHDIWIMNADGTAPRALTDTPNNVDWFSRIAPDGGTVMFTRSKSGWVKEMDAEVYDKWDIWMIGVDGADERNVVENACWGTWRPSGDSIVFARGPKVFIRSLETGEETELFDAEAVFEKKKVYSQQPEMSPDGRFLAITVRGTRRETGIYHRNEKKWYSTGPGCEMSWFPDSRRLVRMNEGHGNGGTQVLSFTINDTGEPQMRLSGLSIPKNARFMDLRGRRSHEYFPRIDQKKGKWLVWGATQYGHEHDIADYELYLWDVTTDKKTGPVRLTFHSSNDRWPDIHLND